MALGILANNEHCYTILHDACLYIIYTCMCECVPAHSAPLVEGGGFKGTLYMYHPILKHIHVAADGISKTLELT